MTTKSQLEQTILSNAMYARALFSEAIDGQLPAGFHVTEEREPSSDSTLLCLRPYQPTQNDVGWQLLHDVKFRIDEVDGESCYVVTEENVRARPMIYQGQAWETVPKQEVCVRVYQDDYPSAVRLTASKVLAQEPFLKLSWRVCPHDKFKFELFADNRKLQSIWKGPSGSRVWGTCVGNTHKTKAAAEREAIDAARFQICCDHQARLAGL